MQAGVDRANHARGPSPHPPTPSGPDLDRRRKDWLPRFDVRVGCEAQRWAIQWRGSKAERPRLSAAPRRRVCGDTTARFVRAGWLAAREWVQHSENDPNLPRSLARSDSGDLALC